MFAPLECYLENYLSIEQITDLVMAKISYVLEVWDMHLKSQLVFQLTKWNVPVYCFDGDGASLMHMGSMAISGTKNLPNLIHIVFNNGCHESVGGQPTVAQEISLSKVALSWVINLR